MEFATVLRKKRKALNLTQQELADQLHVTRQTLSRWENNSTFPNLDTLVELSIILDIPLDNLLKGKDNAMVEKISSDVRDKKKFKHYLIALISIFVIILLWFCLLSFGRANQVAWIDRSNPFLRTQYGYGILPSKGSKTSKNLEKAPGKLDVYVSDDPFGHGQRLRLSANPYDKERRWVLAMHKGSYVSSIREVKKNQIPLQMREQAGNYYIPYDKKVEGPRVGKDTPWWPFS